MRGRGWVVDRYKADPPTSRAAAGRAAAGGNRSSYIDPDTGMVCQNIGGVAVCDPPQGTVRYHDPDTGLDCQRTGIVAVCSNFSVRLIPSHRYAQSGSGSGYGSGRLSACPFARNNNLLRSPRRPTLNISLQAGCRLGVVISSVSAAKRSEIKTADASASATAIIEW